MRQIPNGWAEQHWPDGKTVNAVKLFERNGEQVVDRGVDVHLPVSFYLEAGYTFVPLIPATQPQWTPLADGSYEDFTLTDNGKRIVIFINQEWGQESFYLDDDIRLFQRAANASPLLITQEQMGDIAVEVATENGYMRPIVIGMMVTAMTKLQRVANASSAGAGDMPVPDGKYELQDGDKTWVLEVADDGQYLYQWNKNNTYRDGSPVGCEEIWLGDFRLFCHTPAPTLASEGDA